MALKSETWATHSLFEEASAGSKSSLQRIGIDADVIAM
jgi:hypothetical protein